jgi:hypothetical protein
MSRYPIIVIVVYLIPTLVALYRHHKSTGGDRNSQYPARLDGDRLDHRFGLGWLRRGTSS